MYITMRYVRNNRGRSGSARVALETTLMTVKPTAALAGIVNQSWFKRVTASFDDLVGAGKEGAAHRARNAATYAVSKIPRLRAAPIMPASAIISSTLTKPRAKAIAP